MLKFLTPDCIGSVIVVLRGFTTVMVGRRVCVSDCENCGQSFVYDGRYHFSAIEPFLSRFCSLNCAYDFVLKVLQALRAV